MERALDLHAILWKSQRTNNCNTYLICDENKRILIDQGHADDFSRVRKALQRFGLSIDDIDLIVCTNAHPEHIEAVQLVSGAAALLALHEEAWRLIQKMAAYLRASLTKDLERFAPDFFLSEGALKIDGIDLASYHTPGHSPGSLTIYWLDAQWRLSGHGAIVSGREAVKANFEHVEQPWFAYV